MADDNDVNAGASRSTGPPHQAPTTGELQIIVIDKNFYVSYAKIWETLDDLLNHVGTLVAEDGVCSEYV